MESEYYGASMLNVGRLDQVLDKLLPPQRSGGAGTGASVGRCSDSDSDSDGENGNEKWPELYEIIDEYAIINEYDE